MSQRENKAGPWLALAAAAPAVHFAGNGWLAATLGATAIGWTLLPNKGIEKPGKVVGLVQWGWMVIVLASLLPEIGAYWPGALAEKVVPLVLLALTLGTKDWNASARTGVLLWRGAGALGLAAILASLGQLNGKWLEPAAQWPRGALVTAMLIPSLRKFLPEGWSADRRWLAIPTAAAIMAGVVIQGCVGGAVAQGFRAPLYEVGRCLPNPGIEILIAVAMTLGWFGMCSLMVHTGAEFLGSRRAGEKGARIATAAGSAGLLVMGVRLPEWLLAGGCFLMWGLVPAMKIISKKDEKRY